LRRLPGKLDLVAAAFAAKEPDDLAVVTFCGRLDTDEASERHAGEIDFPLSLLGFFRRRRPLDTFANRLTLSRSDRHFLRFGRLATSSAGAPRLALERRRLGFGRRCPSGFRIDAELAQNARAKVFEDLRDLLLDELLDG